MNTLKPDLAEVNKFFSLLWPSAKEGLLPIFFIGKQKKNVAKFFKIDGLNGETFSIIEKPATRSDVYHAVGLLKARPKGGSRGSEVDVIAIPGLWADVDCRKEGTTSRIFHREMRLCPSSSSCLSSLP